MEDVTYLLFVLDRSGSMNHLRSAVIENFNKLIEDQKKIDAPCFVSLVQFDDKYQEDYLDVALADVQPLTALTYEPRGGTALFDALGRAVTSLGTRIDRLPTSKRPARVIVVVHTDGAENASKEFKAEQVQSIVKANTDEGGWMFIFAGANIDAFAAGGHVGIAKGGIANYVPNLGGTEAVYGATSNAVARSRMMSPQSYKSAVRMQSRGQSAFNAAEIRAMSLGDASQMASEVAAHITSSAGVSIPAIATPDKKDTPSSSAPKSAKKDTPRRR